MTRSMHALLASDDVAALYIDSSHVPHPGELVHLTRDADGDLLVWRRAPRSEVHVPWRWPRVTAQRSIVTLAWAHWRRNAAQ